MTNANVGGFVPDLNGFVAGYSVSVHNELTANTGMTFRVYRDGVATRFRFDITSFHNNGTGCVRARPLNTNPGLYTIDPNNDVVPFKAGERIALRAEAPDLPNITETTDITKIDIQLFYVFEVINNEAIESMLLGGGLPDNVPGGITGSLGTVDEDIGEGGEPPPIIA